MRRPWIRGLVLFLGIAAPGFAVLLVLADDAPVARSRRAVVRTVDPTEQPTVTVNMDGGRASVGPALSPTLSDEGLVTLRTADGATVTRPFRSWVLRCESTEPGPEGRTLLARGVRFDLARLFDRGKSLDHSDYCSQETNQRSDSRYGVKPDKPLLQKRHLQSSCGFDSFDYRLGASVNPLKAREHDDRNRST